MALQLILGGSGSGKSYHLYQDLIERAQQESKDNYFVIVPEQFTLETQKEIVAMHPRHGIMNIDIVSFERLAFRIFEELSFENLMVLDDLGKSMILRKVAANKKKELHVFSGHLHKAGFIGQLKSLLSELFQYGITREQLKELEGKTGKQGLLHEKLKDITVIYEGFSDYLQNAYITTEEILDVLCRLIPNSNLMKDSTITLDGYTGFTPIQYRLIGLLMKYAKKVMITITLDPGALVKKVMEPQNLFYLSLRTMEKLSAIALEHGVPREEDIILGTENLPRFQGSPSLEYLERNFFRFGRSSFQGVQDTISIHVLKNPSAEAEFAAIEIFHLIKEGGYRYKDIAVITGDVAGYRNAIQEKFGANHIPFFLDDKRSIMGNPLVEVMRSALLVVEENFSYESVFRYLKSGMTDLLPEDIDQLENYVIAMGIRGNRRWQETWERAYGREELLNLDKINQTRLQVMEPLLKLYHSCKEKKSNVKDYTTAIFWLISDLSLERKLGQYKKEFEEQAEFSLSKEYEQAYALVLELLDRIVALMGEEVISIREYNDILDSGFEEIKVGIIPACIDGVVVGDIERTRLKEIKVLFFLGVNDGIVPYSSDQGGILSELEREYLELNYMELAPTAKKNSFIQRFYLYLLLTKPSSRLYICYSKMSNDGAARRPSYLIGSMKKMFPNMEICEEELKDFSVDQVISEQTAFDFLIKGIREHKGDTEQAEWKELYRWMSLHPEHKKFMEHILNAAFYHYEERGISAAVAKALYGTTFSGSVTRLEQYASCAYAHFLTYGLELMKRQEFELAAMDMGNVFHQSIDLFFHEFRNQNYDWETITEENRSALVQECVHKVAEEYGNTILKSSARNRYLTERLGRITNRTIWALGEQIKRGDFHPAAFEVSFSEINSLEASAFQLSKEEQMYLRGRIDRMDISEDEQHVYVKVIDYKSGSTTFDLAALYYGLQLQLVVYMDAALELQQKLHPEKEVVPAGIFYYNIQDPIVEREGDMSLEDIEYQILKQLKMNGLVNRDEKVIKLLDKEFDKDSLVIPVTRSTKTGEIMESRSSVASKKQFEQLRRYVHDKLDHMGRHILEGDIEVNPYKKGAKTSCDYCEYRPICGFDLKAGGFHYRKLKSLKAEEIWNSIEEGNEELEETIKAVERGKEL